MESANDTYPGQVVEHFNPSELGVVHSVSSGAVITNGDTDYYTFKAAVTGEIAVRITNNGGDPDGDVPADIGLTLTRRDGGNAVVGAPVNVITTGASGTITFAVTAGTDYFVRVEGQAAGNDALYTLSIANEDREDDLGGNNDRLSTATNLGAYPVAAASLQNYTITSPDRDFFRVDIPAGQSNQTFLASVIMPAGTGASAGASGPTNLGIRVRNSAGTIVATSNTTTTAVDDARFDVPVSGVTQTYYLEVYSGSLGQVNKYDLNLTTIARTGSISGFKWNDINGDGLRQEDEPGLANWQIFIDQDADLTFDAGELATNTDANGFYQFLNLPYGTHTVAETVQANYAQTWPGIDGGFSYTFTLSRDDFALDHLDFGNYLGARVLGAKFNDLDADGAAREGGEPGLVNWRIFVDYDNDGAWDNPTEPSALTDVNGNYTITGVTAGTYRVREVTQGTWTNSFPATADGFGRYVEYTFVSGASFPNTDFGNWTTGSVTGLKFADLDADGLNQEGGEPGLANWRIYVDYDNDGVWNNPTEPSALTIANGTYSITGVNPGTWNLREFGQGGWTNSYPAGGAHSITVTSNNATNGWNFGNWTTAIINGTKFNDLDADGLAREGGEPGLQNWRIYVDYDNDGAWDNPTEPSAVTDVNGNYSIVGVTPGNWTVREEPQGGWTNSFPAAGSYTQLFTSSSVTNGRDFGNRTTGQVTGTKFHDRDSDGTVPEAGELGLQGWRIYVDYNNNSTWDNATEPSAVTDVNGNYTITGVTPGNWNLREELQGGWTQSVPAGGAPYAITVLSAGTVAGRNFGNWTTATLSGAKFEDLDADGAAREGGEPGLAGWTIYVDYNNNGALSAGEPSAVTDANGNYIILGVNPGTWRVREQLIGGWTNSFPATSDGFGRFQSVTFLSQDALVGRDFGNWRPAILTGSKFHDLDADGAAREAGEPGLQGWTIYVDYGNDGVLDAGEPSGVTDVNGNVTVNGVNPGNWFVREVQQTGWTQSVPAGLYFATFVSGLTTPGAVYGNWHTATISGAKFADLDGDGVVGEPGEPGLAGWTIFVDYDDDGVLDAGEPSAVTAAVTGAYIINGVNPGNWKVREVQQGGWTNSAPATSDGFGRYSLQSVASNAALTAVNFGNWQASTISGVKYRDLNGNGAYPIEGGDTPLANWTIYVDYNNDGVLTAGEPSAVTAAVTGAYTINGVAPGTWKVREVVQSGYSNTYPATADAFGRYYQVVVTSNSATANVDFLNYETISISGQKFRDLGTIGVKDVTDQGIGNWQVELYADVNGNGLLEPDVYVGGTLVVAGADGSPLFTTYTNTSGMYDVGGYNGYVVNNKYIIHEVAQQGYQQTFPVAPASPDHAFTYTGSSVTGKDFGNTPCSVDTWNVPVSGSRTITASRVGILTVELTGGGTVSVQKTVPGSNIRYLTTLTAAPWQGTVAEGPIATGLADPYNAGATRVDLLVDVPGTQYTVTYSSAAGTKLRVVNSVNVDVASSLGLQITTDNCGDFVGVYDDDKFTTTSDAKRIFIGAMLGALNSGAPLAFEGIQYDARYINPLFGGNGGNPSISKVDINTGGAADIVRVGDEVTQQVGVNLGEGDDLLRAGGGKQTVYAGGGNDGVVGGVADDTFYGDNGHDLLYGLGGNDSITGSAGNDWIGGGIGNDTSLKGGNDNDKISGGTGADWLYGEAGLDTAYRDASDPWVSGFEIPAQPTDVVQTALEQLIDNVFQDSRVADGDNDPALDTVDELMASLLGRPIP